MHYASHQRWHWCRVRQFASLLLICLPTYFLRAEQTYAEAPTVSDPTSETLSRPALVDIDADGDQDLFTGALEGQIVFFRNTDSAASFSFVRDDDANPFDGQDLGVASVPVFVDIDADGDHDLFVGEFSIGTSFYRNTGTPSAPQFVRDDGGNPLLDANVGRNPVFVDIDSDGDQDVFTVLREDDTSLFSKSSLIFYRNIGSASNPSFTRDDAGNPLTSVVLSGILAPDFADLDGDKDQDLFVGEGSGTLLLFRNRGSPSEPQFVRDDVDNPLADEAFGGNAAASFGDIDGDGDLDAAISGIDPVVTFYRNQGSASNSQFVAAHNLFAGLAVLSDASPSFLDVDGDGDQDLLSGLTLFRNIGSASTPRFSYDPDNGLPDLLFDSAPVATVVDIDNDGDQDLFIASIDNRLVLLRNSGGAHPTYTLDDQNNPFGVLYVGQIDLDAFSDIDGDGDQDAFFSQGDGRIRFYRNTGTPSAPSFTADSAGNPLALHQFDEGYARPAFADVDSDADQDVFMGRSDGTLIFYRNTGSATNPLFARDPVILPFLGRVVDARCAPTFVDLDADGKLDLVVGSYRGIFRHWELTGPPAPTSLSIREIQDTAIGLGWLAPGADSVRLERSPNGTSDWSERSLPGGIDSYSDTTLDEGMTYFYRLLARGVGGVSAPSVTISATTRLAAPANLSAVTEGQAILLRWTTTSTRATRIVVERSQDGTTGWSTVATLPRGAAHYQDRAVVSGATYFYRVQAYGDGTLQSAPSGAIRATVGGALFLPLVSN